MSKILIITFNSHNGFPFFNFFTIMQGMNHDVFRMEGTGLNQGDNFISATNDNVVAGKNLHQYTGMIVVTI